LYSTKEAEQIILAELADAPVQKTHLIEIGSFRAVVIVGEIDASIGRLAKLQLIALIEPGSELRATSEQNSAFLAEGKFGPSGITPSPDTTNSLESASGGNNVVVQTNAPWNLSRVCRRVTYASISNFYFDSYGCADVDAYILDTGVAVGHPQFQGRASHAANFTYESNADDLNGHGTHVAGVVGAQLYGVCKQIQIKSVKILAGNGAGNSVALLLALQWVAQNHRKDRKSIVK